jgi:hypothetical protein
VEVSSKQDVVTASDPPSKVVTVAPKTKEAAKKTDAVKQQVEQVYSRQLEVFAAFRNTKTSIHQFSAI